MAIGKMIRRRREELGISQDELAKRVGYKSRSTINKIEKDVNDITQSKIVEIANALNTTTAYLMGWDNEDEMLKGVKKTGALTFSIEDSFSYYNLDLKKIVYSGIFDSYKKYNNEYYKWHYETISKLDIFVKTINESIEFTLDQDLPMISVNKKHFKIFSRDFLNDIIYQKEGLQKLLDMLGELSVMSDEDIKTLYNELENPTNKREILENEYSTHDFSVLSNDEIEKYYTRYLEVVKLENEKFKKILCIK